MDGRPVGYLFEIDHRGSRHAFHIAYDLAYQKAGPGVVLLAQAIRDAHAEGLRGYDLGGDEAYLRRWTDESIAHVDLRITRGSLPSRIKASVYVRIRERRKILARRRTEEKKNARKAAGATSAEADASDQ